MWYFLPEFATGHRLVVSDGGEITLRFIHLQSTIIANFQFCNSYCVFYFILYNVSTSKQTVQCSCSYIRHLSVKGPSLLADQCSAVGPEEWGGTLGGGGILLEIVILPGVWKLAGEGGGGFVPGDIQHLAAVDREEALNCVIYWWSNSSSVCCPMSIWWIIL